MDGYNRIVEKLNEFSKKYYTKMLLTGVILFGAFGLAIFLLVTSVEYFLWLGSTGRLILLVLFGLAQAVLLYRFVLVPLFYLFKLKKGISNKDASVLIGKHFPEVGDKLSNLLDLAGNGSQTELVVASIEQRAHRLSPVPFSNAINFKESVSYLKYLIVPVLVLVVVYVSGNFSSFFGSVDRVVNYRLAYEPPAPYRFLLMNDSLETLDNESFTVVVSTIGEMQPEQIWIKVNGEDYLMKKNNGRYEYTFQPPLTSSVFEFVTASVISKEYQLSVVKTPIISDFYLDLNYPDYLNKKNEKISATGNATIPEGTTVVWNVETVNTDQVELITKDTVFNFLHVSNQFQLQQKVYANLYYEISSSNVGVQDFEKLSYNLNVIKDASPTIRVNQMLDSLNPNIAYYAGEVGDDYKVREVKLVYYPTENPDLVRTLNISTPNSNYEEFYYTFPSGLDLDNGKVYDLYFTVKDNDGLRGGKIVKSQVFSMGLLDESDLNKRELEVQENLIKSLDGSLKQSREEFENLKELSEGQKEKTKLNFNDQSEVKDFLRRQQQQEAQMEKFSEQLKDNLEKSDRNDLMKQMLKERLERQELEAKKNQQLLEELDKIANKIQKEELTKRLEDIAKKQQSSDRNLEQLVELMKRYYAEEKAQQLSDELHKLSERQVNLSNTGLEDDLNFKEQKGLNEDFEDVEKELNELEEDNNRLNKPLNIKVSDKDIEGVKEDQKSALEELQKHEVIEQGNEGTDQEDKLKKASKRQKSAADKMEEMAKSLSQSSSTSGESTDAEDAEMLRQILDNLITFSFKQESLYDRLEGVDSDSPQFSNSIKDQQGLRELFEHVDDSIFSLSLRRAEISEFVNEQITEVYYNIDKSLESIAENQIYQGASYQKYVLNASNSLADFLARILDNMNQSMMSGQGKGQGEGQGFQLPDIIKSQKDLQERMSGQNNKGEGKSSGSSGENGEKGKGADGQDSKNGLSGQKGEGGAGEGDGKGNSGKNESTSDGNGEGRGQQGISESELNEIYQIYKEQQMIRQKLEEQLRNMINDEDRKLGEKLARQMETFENDLLENGITTRNLDRINQIQHQLLKLENADLKQGNKSERESNTGRESFVNPIISKPSFLDNYNNDIEILNRQALPLRQNYQNKVKEYFKGDD
ncbi:hypothetical protein [Cytophaga sp. FL35]|uniref:hypothetical protein n=1 Tax=Cytophaga sp. FL35 TaxID=1904456 RepID=UPI001653C046|nr:hypothetical protein [Cytophaga sp. FL35]MBC6997579.1 hypothetical protein [Cytophaga sp. FL35]